MMQIVFAGMSYNVLAQPAHQKSAQHFSTPSPFGDSLSRLSGSWGEAMMNYYEDDTYTEADFEQVIGGIGSLNAEMTLVEMMMDKGDIPGAVSRANAIPMAVPFGKGEGLEDDAFMDWITLRKDMMMANRDWHTMNASDVSALENLLLYFDSYAASQAMQVLNEFAGADYFIPPAYGVNGVAKRARVTAADISANMLRVYPNPADYRLTIELKESLPTQEMCILIITDAMGKEVNNQQVNSALKQFLIDTKDWAVGLYAFKIVVPNSPIELNGKFDVVH
jgi:Secretion system C-terminal sorting domain